MTRTIVPSAEAVEKCQHLETWRTANPYGHQDAMRRLTGRDALAISGMIGLGRRTVQSWRDLDPDHRGPAETLEAAVVAALQIGRPVEDALAPVAVLAAAFGYRLSHASAAAAEPSCAAADLTRAAGAALHQALLAAADGKIEQSELPAVNASLDALSAEIDRMRATANASAAKCVEERAANKTPLRAVTR